MAVGACESRRAVARGRARVSAPPHERACACWGRGRALLQRARRRLSPWRPCTSGDGWVMTVARQVKRLLVHVHVVTCNPMPPGETDGKAQHTTLTSMPLGRYVPDGGCNGASTDAISYGRNGRVGPDRACAADRWGVRSMQARARVSSLLQTSFPHRVQYFLPPTQTSFLV